MPLEEKMDIGARKMDYLKKEAPLIWRVFKGLEEVKEAYPNFHFAIVAGTDSEVPGKFQIAQMVMISDKEIALRITSVLSDAAADIISVGKTIIK